MAKRRQTSSTSTVDPEEQRVVGFAEQGGRSGGLVDAPGKRRRKPMPSTPGTKHSDTRIAKLKVMSESRRRGGR